MKTQRKKLINAYGGTSNVKLITFCAQSFKIYPSCVKVYVPSALAPTCRNRR